MLVDDDPQFLKLLRLSLAGFRDVELCCCQDGAEALSRFAEAPGSFQIVITDLLMPGIDGLVLSARLRALAPGLRIILITGDSAGISEPEAGELGFSATLYKPFTAGALHAAIRQAVESLEACPIP
jgi:two-component system cell cycle sensor histidine kinase/response regulator CckA